MPRACSFRFPEGMGASRPSSGGRQSQAGEEKARACAHATSVRKKGQTLLANFFADAAQGHPLVVRAGGGVEALDGFQIRLALSGKVW